MSTRRLNNTEVEEIYFGLIIERLEQLAKVDNPALRQLLMKCEDPTYGFKDFAHHRLRDLELLHSNYDVPDSVKAIVLFCVKDDGKGTLHVESHLPSKS